MEVQQDFRELLALLNKHKVEYVIVGAYALARHGAPRYTGDLDILVKPESPNGANILQALKEFGFGSLDLSKDDFREKGRVIQLGFPPIRIDIMTSITGISWEEAFDGSIEGGFGDLKVRYLGLKELISNKRALGRKKDLADLEAIGEE